MKILVVALLKESQINYKIKPLSFSNEVDEIFLVRKKKGPEIKKVNYIVLPKICRFTFFYLSLTPVIIIYHLLNKKIDLILSYHFVPHGFFAFLASLFTRIPFIYSQIDMDIQNYTRNKTVRFFILKILKRATRINVPGSVSRKFWIKNGIKEEKIVSIHSTIDTKNDYYPKHVDKIYDFIYVGTFEKRKQVHLIIQAFSEFKKTPFSPTLALIGDGEEKENLENLIHQLDLKDNVLILGQQLHVVDFLNKSKIFIMTSSNEGLPCALMEAMACELITITVNIADISDVVKNKRTGFLLKDYQHKNIYSAMLQCYTNYENLTMVKINARKIIVDKHSFMSAEKEWSKLLVKIKDEHSI